MKIQLVRFVVCCFLGFAPHLSVAAQDIYMFIGNGSGGGDGTQGNPYDVSTTNLFEQRLAQAASGSVVHLASGVYKRVNTSDTFVNNSISIIGAGSSLTTIINLSAPSTGIGITLLALYGDVTVKGITLNCNSTNWPSVGKRYNGLFVEGSAVVDDVIVRNARGDWAAGGFESFPLILTHTSSIPSSFNNISVLEVKADVGSTNGRAYVSPLTMANYTDQYVYITNLYIDTGTNRAVCAFAPYGRNYIVRNVSNSGYLSSGIWGDADGSAVSVHTIENVDWSGGQIIAKVPIRFGVDLPLRLRVHNVSVSDVTCDHGPADNWEFNPPNGWDEVEGIILGGSGTEVDGLFVNRLKCSWPAVTLPYSTGTYPYWHMGVINLGVTNSCKNIVIQDSVFIPAHTSSGWTPFRNWVYVWEGAPVPITPPTLINCRDTQNRFYSDNWSGGDFSFSDTIGNKLFGIDSGNFFVTGVLRAGSANTQITDSSGKILAGSVTGVLPVANGGTGAATKTDAFDALAPATTTGDITYYNGTDNVRLPIGAEGKALVVGGSSPGWGDALQETGESSNTPVTDTASTTVGAANLRLFDFFTFPTTEKLYVITGIEWKNGSTVAGNTICGAVLVNANPPTQAAVPTVAFGQLIANSGANSIQRVSTIVSHPIRGGTTIGVFVQADATTHTYRTATVTSANNRKTVGAFPFGGDVLNQENAAWTSSTTKAYLKIYYRGYK